jgi:hypothetical protein
MHMNANRTERISVNLTPEVMRALEALAAANHWTVSTAAAVLIERGLTVK